MAFPGGGAALDEGLRAAEQGAAAGRNFEVAEEEEETKQDSPLTVKIGVPLLIAAGVGVMFLLRWLILGGDADGGQGPNPTTTTEMMTTTTKMTTTLEGPNPTTTTEMMTTTTKMTTTTQAPVVDICQTAEDFRGSATMPPSCNFQDLPSDADCTAAGCEVDTKLGGCKCFTARQCETAGGVFESWTCNAAINNAPASMIQAITEIQQSGGTCKNKTVSIGSDVYVETWVSTMALFCCASAPLDFCQDGTVEFSPCTAPEQFNFQAPYEKNGQNGRCAGGIIPQMQCESAGCFFGSSDGRCDCSDQDSCEQAGLVWLEEKCGSAWVQLKTSESPVWSELFDGVAACSDDSLGEAWKAATNTMAGCCNDSPLNYCVRGDWAVSFCDAGANFLPDKEVSGDCDGEEHTPESECNAAGCEYSVGQFGGRCECYSRETCERLATWVSQTCQSEFMRMQFEEFKAMERATARLSDSDDLTPCNESEAPAKAVVDRLADDCCTNFPVSLCNPQAVQPAGL